MDLVALARLAALSPDDPATRGLEADVERILAFVASVQAATGSDEPERPDVRLAEDAPASAATDALAVAPGRKDGFVALPRLFQDAT